MNGWSVLLDLQWRWPWAALLLALPAGLMLWQRWRHRRALAYADEALRPWALSTPCADAGQKLQRALAALAWLLLVLAAAGPRWPVSQPADTAQAGAGAGERAGATALVLLQLSDSMRATDLAPDRLTRARLALLDLSEQQRGEQVGLLVYGAQSGVLLPPTHDAALLRDALNATGEYLVPAGRADLAQALTLAALELEQLAQETPARQPGTLLLVTDADSDALQGAAGAAVDAALRRLRVQGVALQMLLVTAPTAATADTGPAASGMGFGAPVADPAAYRALAEQTGGSAVHVSDGTEAVRRWYQNSLDRVAVPATPAGRAVQGWREGFALPLALGALLMLLAHTPGWPAGAARFGERVWMALRRRPSGQVLSAGLVALVLLLASAPERSWAQANATAPFATRQQLAQASQAHAAQQWALAQQRYAQVGGFGGHFGAGVAALQLHDGLAAQRHLGLAWTLATTPAQRLDALYNLGLAQARLGRWAAAAQAFGAVLQERPGDAAATNNLRIAEKEATRQRAGVGDAQDLYGRRGKLVQGQSDPNGTGNPDELDMPEGGSSYSDSAVDARGATASAPAARAPAPGFVPQPEHLNAGLAKLDRLANPRPRLFKGLMAQDTPRVNRALATERQP